MQKFILLTILVCMSGYKESLENSAIAEESEIKTSVPIGIDEDCGFLQMKEVNVSSQLDRTAKQRRLYFKSAIGHTSILQTEHELKLATNSTTVINRITNELAAAYRKDRERWNGETDQKILAKIQVLSIALKPISTLPGSDGNEQLFPTNDNAYLVQDIKLVDKCNKPANAEK